MNSTPNKDSQTTTNALPFSVVPGCLLCSNEQLRKSWYLPVRPRFLAQIWPFLLIGEVAESKLSQSQSETQSDRTGQVERETEKQKSSVKIVEFKKGASVFWCIVKNLFYIVERWVRVLNLSYFSRFQWHLQFDMHWYKYFLRPRLGVRKRWHIIFLWQFLLHLFLQKYFNNRNGTFLATM